MQSLRVFPGAPYPLGATVTPQGVNFAIFSENATGVDLCLFDSANSPTEILRIPLSERTEHVWHCLLPESDPGQLYGFRVHGPFDPQHGHRFNPAKLLLDPYAKAITGLINWGTEMFAYPQNGGQDADLLKDERDSAWCMPKCVVVDDAFDWGNDRLLRVPMSETVVYEVHVKGFSKLCPGIPEELRGSYAALGTHFRDRVFQKAGHHRGGIASHPPLCERRISAEQRAHQLLGIQFDRIFLRRTQPTPRATPRRANRCASLSKW